MKNKNLQPVPEIFTRAAHQRVGAVVVIGALLLGAVTLERESRAYLREAVARPAFSFLNIIERENETARMPVKFDDGLRLPTTGGE